MERLTLAERMPSQRCSSDAPVLEPLVFNTRLVSESCAGQSKSEDLPCILQTCTFSAPFAEDLTSHIMLSHKMVIADLKALPDLKGYLLHWKSKLTEDTITNYCYGIKALVSRQESSEAEEDLFYMLSDTLPEDKEIRLKLQQKRLQDIIHTVEQERSDTHFNRRCLFCNTVFAANRSVLFEHLKTKHNLFLGNPDNIVFAAEFLDFIEAKLKLLKCLYCENTFKSRDVLMEHMRKKGHKQLNPDNHEYDKFYVVNYAELGKNWQDLKEESSTSGGNYLCYRTDKEVRIVRDDEDKDCEVDDWSDWTEEEAYGLGAVCLFCEAKLSSTSDFEAHLKDRHKFDFAAVKTKLSLTFYQQVKMVNYIRRQIHQRKCIYCRDEFEDSASLISHMDVQDHRKVPELSVWDQPEYFFPTYEDDSLLLLLEDEDTHRESASVADTNVIPEELKLPLESVLLSEQLRSELN